MCKNGKSQSPVNISSTLSAEVGGLNFHYSAAPLSILNNGHTIQVNYAPGSYLDVGGTRYDLLQFHFHSPSENTLNNQPFALEAHLVHKGADGTLAVVGILFEESNQSHPILTGIWDNMPASAGPATTVSSVRVNANTLLPQNRNFYQFKGSLTTPPCSEGVKWFVMQGTFGVTRAHIDKFVSTVGHNARPTQPLNGRQIVSVGSGGGH
jgi:carbonic anhydrase